jgi:uncharacterized membrane protein
MNRGLWCAALLLAFWACGGEDPQPGAVNPGEGGGAGEPATGGKAPVAGSSAEPVAGMGGVAEPPGGAPGSFAGDATSPGGGAAGTGSSSAGAPAAGAAGAAGAPSVECPASTTGTNCDLPRFEVLKQPNSATISVGIGLSADGSVAVGNTGTAQLRAGFRWTHAAGLLLLDALPTQSGSVATAVSADGKVVVGTSGAALKAVYWPAGKATPQSLLDAGWKALEPTHVSADGSVIAGVGTLTNGTTRAPFRWTKAGGAVALGSLAAQTISIVGMSSDGSVIVGNSDDLAVNGFIWKAADPLKVSPLPLLAGDDQTKVLALSADGSTAVGDSIKGVKARRVRWPTGGQPVLLDALDTGTAWGCGGGPFTTCSSMSKDGSVIYTQRGGIAQRWTAAKGLEALPVVAGKFNCMPFSPDLPRLDWIPGNCIGPPVAVVWDDQDKAARMDAVLATFGVTATELTNATITVVRAVSANGDTILGDNFNSTTVWVARVLP